MEVQNAPHRTVLEDFPHTALQLNSQTYEIKYRSYVLFLVVGEDTELNNCTTYSNSYSSFDFYDLTICGQALELMSSISL